MIHDNSSHLFFSFPILPYNKGIAPSEIHKSDIFPFSREYGWKAKEK